MRAEAANLNHPHLNIDCAQHCKIDIDKKCYEVAGKINSVLLARHLIFLTSLAAQPCSKSRDDQVEDREQSLPLVYSLLERV